MEDILRNGSALWPEPAVPPDVEELMLLVFTPRCANMGGRP
jgi:hypothetical protein